MTNFNTAISEVIPLPFNEMTIYQLCSWLCMNPNILQLANNMHLSMQTPAVEALLFISSGFTLLQKQDNKVKTYCDFLEELKCLFLHIRNLLKSVLEELIRNVIKCDLNDAEGIEWIQTANRHFGDFRNKLVNGVEDSVRMFKKKRRLLVLNVK